MLERVNYSWHGLLRPSDMLTINESMLERDKYILYKLLRPPDK
jgi:hypothetical protein